ncbi:MAG TPA: S9 family peptidase [Candidatus Sulfotelmatobacter sp.]|nr:S9 family peptidase [Candidatus Sulfotelmatobacter sp.]
MKGLHLVWIVLLVIGSAGAAAQSAGPEDRRLTDPQSIQSVHNANARPVPIEDLYYTRALAGASWSPDGKEIAFSMNMSGRENLWKVDAAGSWPIQLVQSNERQYSETWSPDGKWIVYQQDTGGNELWDIWAVPSAGGEAINLTNTPEIREESPRWAPDGKSIAINYKPKEGNVYNLALLDWGTRKTNLLTHEETPNHSWGSVAWSPDGKTIYANRVEVSFTDSDVYAVDVASGKTTNLTPHEGKVLNFASSLSSDGKTLLITSNQKGGYQNVALLDVASKKLTWVTDTRWEAGAGDFSPKGDSFTYTINADGLVDAYLANAKTMRGEKIALEPGVNGFAAYPNSYSPSGNRLLVSHQSSVRPDDYWVYDLATRRMTQLTQSAIASLSAAAMPTSQIVHYKTFDGKTISALMWVPFNLKRDHANPALVLPHGGPTGQVTDYWSPRVAALVSRGYICIAPNVRGSTGYGIEFQRANYQDLGGGDLQDEVFATKFLVDTGYVDSKKIGITGGSYGGFMTLMAIGKTPDVWAAAVELFGIIDWMTMLEHSDPELQQYEKSLLGDPVKDKKVYEATSPIAYIHNVKAPLLVLQGDNDPRVPKEEAVQVVELLKKDGKTVDAHYYPDEGHGFAKRENQIDSIRRTVEWFDKYLKGSAAQ